MHVFSTMIQVIIQLHTYPFVPPRSLIRIPVVSVYDQSNNQRESFIKPDYIIHYMYSFLLLYYKNSPKKITYKLKNLHTMIFTICHKNVAFRVDCNAFQSFKFTFTLKILRKCVYVRAKLNSSKSCIYHRYFEYTLAYVSNIQTKSRDSIFYC